MWLVLSYLAISVCVWAFGLIVFIKKNIYAVEMLWELNWVSWNVRVDLKFKSKYECTINGPLGETVSYLDLVDEH